MITFFFIISILVVLARLIHKLWWKPLQIQKILRSQGIKGPSYKLIHGNTKDILKMRKEAISSCDDLCSHDVFPRILPHLNTWIKLYGSNFLIWMGDQPQIIVTEPELAREILTNKDGIYKKCKPLNYVKRLLGDGLVVAEGEKWSKLRKLSNYAFHGDSLKDMVPAMVESVDTMLERFEGNVGKEIEISKEFKLLTSDIISKTAFGSTYVEGQDIFDMLMKLVVLITRNAFKIRPFGLKRIWRPSDEIEADRVEKSLRDSIVSLVRKREDMVRTGQLEDFGNDFLGALMKVNHEVDPKIRISLDDIVDECKVFFIAGHETTSSLLSWTALLLSIHEEWQERARDEVLHLFGMDKPTAQGLSRLKILTMILNEALRLYSPVLALTRKVGQETRLGRYKIPADVEVYIPPLALHRNHEIWGRDAHLFKPERFGDGVAKAANGNPTALDFLPFGAGPRACVGLNFAGHEAKVALIMILQRYKLTLSPNYVHAPFQLLTVNPQHGIQIILQSA
ncbi:cytochrome P450 CYP749A22-like [Salvia miltiorrhiza]|uniref:cytochrome P450 CYP749A22-like n=1 Tax=Salvia miltiorrhiza TaxID=226208 RepID=UPI0025AD57D1|nr:cytochrome P450 CYP749A22-like [Salvia miltiorrhiza]